MVALVVARRRRDESNEVPRDRERKAKLCETSLMVRRRKGSPRSSPSKYKERFESSIEAHAGEDRVAQRRQGSGKITATVLARTR